MGKYIEASRGFRRRQEKARSRDRGRGADGRSPVFLGDVENSPLLIERTIKRLAGRDTIDCIFVFEAGPDGIRALPANPSAWPRMHGGRSGSDPETVWRAGIETNRRDAVALARAAS